MLVKSGLANPVRYRIENVKNVIAALSSILFPTQIFKPNSNYDAK